MRGIARDAGVGLGTLQNHFPTKETLWKSVIDELIVPAEEHFSVVSGPEALVTEIVRHRLASAVHRPGLAGHVLADGSAEGEVCSTTWRRRPAVAERSAASSSGRPWRRG